MKEEISKEFLIDAYYNKNLSISQIARELNCSFVKVSNALNKFGITKKDSLNDNKKRKDLLRRLSKEEFSEYFINQLLTYKEISEIIGCSERQLRRINSEVFKIKRTKEENLKFKNRFNDLSENLKKGRDAYKKSTGFNNPSNDPLVQEKRKNVFLEKYGVDNPGKDKRVQEKIKNTLLEKYGVENPSQIREIKEKISKNISISKLEISPEKLKILLDKELFTEFINSLEKGQQNFSAISKLFGIDETTIAGYVNKYDLRKLMNLKFPVSSFERELIAFLKSIGITNIERNTKKYLNGQEIDIYIPDKRIGIEFNGNYWHSENQKSQRYHQEKSLLAAKNNIFIYHIFEYEWQTKKEKIKAHLKNILLENNRIFARKCELRTVGKDEKKEFLNKYHLQGNDHSLYEYGLFYKGELVMVMTFCKARFTKGDWELSRMCSKSGLTIVGGASKLLKHFITINGKSGETIITYNDIGKSRGNVYAQIGFSKSSISKPSYVWWKSHQDVISRYKTQIKNEITSMHECGYIRIFDCGNNVWKMKI